ncbi:MAG: ceramidase domain-containing protein [Pseudomonadota bacterium]
MEWSRRIDGYCERTGPEFWSEPVNAVSNLAFILAAIFCLIIALRLRRLDGPVIWLDGVLFAIGIGSFLFHTFATVWAALMDTGPILLFILSYFTVAMNRYVGLGWGRAILLTVGFLGALVTAATMTRGAGPEIILPAKAHMTQTIGFWIAFALAFGSLLIVRAGLVPALGVAIGFPAAAWIAGVVIAALTGPGISGWESYFPAMLALVSVGGWLAARAHPAGLWLIAAALVFAVSLSFRTIDDVICAHFAMGTHFLWHILNAVVLGTLLMAVIRHGAMPQRD